MKKAPTRSVHPPNSSVPQSYSYPFVQLVISKNILLERVGAGAPPDEEGGKANSLNDLGEDGDAHGLQWPALLEDLGQVLL